jgi:quinol monooxygenase YgiN
MDVGILVMATVELAPGQREPFLSDLVSMLPEIRREEGCLEYLVATDLTTSLPAQGPTRYNVVVTIERWRNVRDCEAHLQAPHIATFMGRNRARIVSASLQILQAHERER